MTHKPLVFIGDIHGNAQAMTQILQMYPQEYYFLVWSGDFINSKKQVSDKEIEYVLHMMISNCHNVLYSNHMHMMYKYLLSLSNSTIINDDSYYFPWPQTKRVLSGLHEDIKEKLLEHCLSSYFCIRYYNSLMAHAYVDRTLINKQFKGILTNTHKKAIGIGNTSNLYWQHNDKETTSLSQEFKYLITGHHGLILRHDNIRIIDLKGIQVPVWEEYTDTIKIYPL